MKGKKKIRLLSLGTGEKTFKPIEKGTDFTKLAMLKKLGEFMMNMDTYSADYYLFNEFNDKGESDKYLRLQKTSNVGMDKIDKKNIDQLKIDGKDLYNLKKVELEKMIRDILDERYGKKHQKQI